MTETDTSRARLVGINHVALEVGDIEAALDFYGDIFEFDLRGQSASGAFLDMGDQFLALMEVDRAVDKNDDHRHFGLVVDDAGAIERRLEKQDIDRLDTPGIDFRDPWGNHIQIVAYEEIQFSKANYIFQGMGLGELEKSESALRELADKGMKPK